MPKGITPTRIGASECVKAEALELDSNLFRAASQVPLQPEVVFPGPDQFLPSGARGPYQFLGERPDFHFPPAANTLGRCELALLRSRLLDFDHPLPRVDRSPGER